MFLDAAKRLRPHQRQPHLPRGQGGARARDGRHSALLFVETHGLRGAALVMGVMAEVKMKPL